MGFIPLTCSLGCFTKHFIEKIGYKMVLRQPTSRQQVGTLYEMTSPLSLWNVSPQTTRVQKHAARHRATNQSFRLSTNARARVKHARARVGGTPSRQTPASRGFSRKCGGTTRSRKGETQREKISGENDAKWKMSFLWFVNKKKLLLYHSEMLKFVQIYLKFVQIYLSIY